MSTNPMVIPQNERCGVLKQVLFEYVNIIANLRNANPNLAKQQPSLFFFLSFPWLVEQNTLTVDQKDFLERRKLEAAQLSFDGERAKKQLEDILAVDKHLAECCPTLVQLANYLDTSFIRPVADAKRVGTAQQQLDFAYEEFESQTYHQGRFRRIALSHLFNFNMDANSAMFAGDERTVGNIRIERIDHSTIPRILGESGFQAFLHPPLAGNCFVVEEEGASSMNDVQWLSNKRAKAYYFAEVLQYFKDGVVHLGYSVPFFLPNWADQIRRIGLFFLGDPRRSAYENGRKSFLLSEAEQQQFSQWWKAATKPTLVEAFANKKGKLRQATYRAARYYESSHERSDVVERLIAVAIGMESLFSPGDQGELSFRISQSAAQFIGRETAERQKIFADLRDMYNRRSKLLHGTYDIEKYEQGKFVTSDEIDLWATYLRRAYLGFLTIYLRAYFNGKKEEPRDPLLDRIAEANFDEAKGQNLREDSDIDKLLGEVSLDRL